MTTERAYVGYRDDSGAVSRVYVEERTGPSAVDPRPLPVCAATLARHGSPPVLDFDWGANSADAATLARSILADHVGWIPSDALARPFLRRFLLDLDRAWAEVTLTETQEIVDWLQFDVPRLWLNEQQAHGEAVRW